jgi:hypothetical protein
MRQVDDEPRFVVDTVRRLKKDEGAAGIATLGGPKQANFPGGFA